MTRSFELAHRTGLAICFAATVACSSSGKDDTTARTVDPGTLPDGGPATVPTTEPPPTTTPPPLSPHLGALVVQDIADTACEQAAGAAAEVTPAAPDAYPLDRLGRVGDQRFAVSSEGLALVTFAANGSTQGTSVPGIVTAAASGTSIAALALGEELLELRRFDAAGAVIGSPVPLQTGVHEGQAIAANATQTFVAWSVGKALRGKILDAAGNVALELDLGADAAGAGTYSMRAVVVDGGFALVWTRERNDQKVETLIRRVGADGSLSPPVTVLLATGDHSLSDVSSAGGEVGVLLDEGQPAVAAVVVRLDATNKPISTLRLLGSQRAFGLAMNGGDSAIVAAKGNRAAFRAVSGTAALGAWICLDDLDGSSDGYPWAAVDVEGAGYATVSWAKNGAHVLRKLDRAGVSAPL